MKKEREKSTTSEKEKETLQLAINKLEDQMCQYVNTPIYSLHHLFDVQHRAYNLEKKQWEQYVGVSTNRQETGETKLVKLQRANQKLKKELKNTSQKLVGTEIWYIDVVLSRKC